MSHQPPTEPPDDPPSQLPRSRRQPITAAAFGLSLVEFDELCTMMLGIVGSVGCPPHVSRRDVVHDAFVLALSKPISERPSSTDREKFVAWMCALAKYAAWTVRNAENRRRIDDAVSDEDLATILSTPAHVPDVGMRKALSAALASLDMEDRALLHAHFVQDKSIKEIAEEQQRSWSTTKWRIDRAVGSLRVALKSVIMTALLLVSETARAHGTRLARHVSRLLPHPARMMYAMGVTVACGVMIPASSPAMHEHEELSRSTTKASTGSETAIAVTAVPSAPVEIAPVKRIGLDEPAEQWSARNMKSTNLAICIHSTAVPMAFFLASALTQFGCAGGERHASPPPQPPVEKEEGGGGTSAYDDMCESERARGGKCPSKEEWCEGMCEY